MSAIVVCNACGATERAEQSTVEEDGQPDLWRNPRYWGSLVRTERIGGKDQRGGPVSKVQETVLHACSEYCAGTLLLDPRVELELPGAKWGEIVRKRMSAVEKVARKSVRS